MAYPRTQHRFNPNRNAAPVGDRFCFFCREQYDTVPYKDTQLLQKFLSTYQKILPRKKTGVCMKHQRKLARAVKRARFMALLPYIPT